MCCSLKRSLTGLRSRTRIWCRPSSCTWPRHVPSVPQHNPLRQHPIVDKYDLSALRCILSGAAPLGHETEVACAKRLHCAVKQAYGMTEMSPASHIKCGSCGP